MSDLRFAAIGCGFWAQAQIAAWGELPGVTLVAVCDRDESRAQATARRFGVPAYSDADAMLTSERLDFVDIITDVATHAELTALALRRGIPVITQKPMAPDLATARGMLACAQQNNTALFVHENFRWQAPLRRVGSLLHGGAIGDPFRGRFCFNSAFPVFDNQPALAELDQFILTDVGTHVLDVARFFFGEARTLTCATRRVNPTIRGEDVASVMMEMQTGTLCSIELSYASRLEHESFPQTLALVEGTDGTIVLNLDGEIVITTRAGTRRETITPQAYPWADPAYAVAHASLVDCNRDLLNDLRGVSPAETTATDNYQTLRLVFACYASARQGRTINLAKEPDEDWDT